LNSDAWVNLGGENQIAKEQIVVIARPDSPPIQRLIAVYKRQDKVIDLSRGQPARSVILTAAGYLVLSSLRAKTVADRCLESD
jgi:regulator of extracellular matrix RemA (YlzA/DUF370 family)